MSFEIRKVVCFKEIVHREGGKALSVPITLLGVAAVIRNPWHGRGFVEDLGPEQRAGCAELGRVMVERVLQEIGGAAAIQSYGKAAVVGMEGEIEHASAVIHNLRFGNVYRDAVSAETYLSFTNKRGGPDTSLQIPMKHLHDGAARSHFITLEFSIPDAPAANEIAVLLGAATGGRAHPRIGDRHRDREEMAVPAQGGAASG
ncbi:MAG: amino acid synthesis family protein [Burkholderiaceae bacterium]